VPAAIFLEEARPAPDPRSDTSSECSLPPLQPSNLETSWRRQEPLDAIRAASGVLDWFHGYGQPPFPLQLGVESIITYDIFELKPESR
jgi:hypothetical protein